MHGSALDGSQLSLVWALPFVGLLFSIALLPLLTPRLWHRHYGKIAGGWALATLLPMAVLHGADVAAAHLAHTTLLEYIPFVALMLALYTATAGIRFQGRLGGAPLANTAVLAVGTGLASFIGTTGAAMLLIRPLIEANAWRRHRAHVVVFFIFLVGNIGGSLTPLGDAPLFLGFLKGVDFFWPTWNLFLPMLAVALPVLGIFFVLDWLAARREALTDQPAAPGVLLIEGGGNFVLLGLILVAVALSGLVDSGILLLAFGVELRIEALLRDVALVGLALAAWRLGSAKLRARNGFSWAPMFEVGKLFAAIFITVIPPLAILAAGEAGAAAPLLAALGGAEQPNNLMYFWITGTLSSFLDNAPTYLIFFNAAGGDAAFLMNEQPLTLLAVSTGAVFMGAMTYIGNAPNFMVRSIAETRGVRMPGFFGFMLWSGAVLLPVLLAYSLIYF